MAFTALAQRGLASNLRLCSSRSAPVKLANRHASRAVTGWQGVPLMQRSNRTGRVAAQSSETEIEGFINKVTEKFEKADNKPIIVAYIVAVAAAILTAEWFIHLPGLNVILGFPVQLVGLLVLPYLTLRYYVDGDSNIVKDLESYTDKVTKKLPGLNGK